MKKCDLQKVLKVTLPPTAHKNINKQNILKIVNFIRSNQSPLIRNILDFDQDDILKRNNSKSGALIYENSVLCTILKDS